MSDEEMGPKEQYTVMLTALVKGIVRESLPERLTEGQIIAKREGALLTVSFKATRLAHPELEAVLERVTELSCHNLIPVEKHSWEFRAHEIDGVPVFTLFWEMV